MKMLLYYRLLVLLPLFSFGYAQPVVKPWYGSTIGFREILKSKFCEQYKCQVGKQRQYVDSKTKENRSYIQLISLRKNVSAIGSGTNPSMPNEKIQINLVKNGKGNLDSLMVIYNGRFGPPPYTQLYDYEAGFLTDLIYFALGKKYSFVKTDGDANPTNDMNVKCMNGIDLKKKVYRILEQGMTRFEGENKSRPYLAYCMVRPIDENPNSWPEGVLPMFVINESIYIPK